MTQINNPPIDVAATLEEIRQSVRQQRARLDGLVAAARGLGATQRDPRFVELSGAVRQLNELWSVSAHLPITWTRPGIGAAVAFVKKVVRYLLRWYINPIVEQQNSYNAAAARAADQIVETLEWLALKHAALEARISALEALGAGERGNPEIVVEPDA